MINGERTIPARWLGHGARRPHRAGRLQAPHRDPAREIAALAAPRNLILGVTYGYGGHPMLHQMAAMTA
jgi:hypothetical protein